MALFTNQLQSLPRLSAIRNSISSWSSLKKSALTASIALPALILPGAAFALQSNQSEATKVNLDQPIQKAGAEQPASASAQNTTPPTSTTDSVELHVNAQSGDNNSSSTPSTLTVNGTNIPIPQNGTVQKNIKTPGSNTNLDISINNGGLNTSTSVNSTTNVDVYSHSSSTGANDTVDPRALPRR